MSELEDVVRWSSAPDAPEGMRELLRAAGPADEPTAAELANLRTRMAPQLAPTAGAGLSSARAILTGLVVVGVVIGIVAFVTTRSDHAVNLAQPERVRPEPATPPPHDVPLVQPVIVVPPVEAPPPPTTNTPSRRPPHKPVIASPAPAAAIESARPAPAAAETPPTPQISEDELLEQARAALRGGNAAQAVALTEQHATQYGDGVLVEEREALAIESLLKLGRADDARTRWSKFATAYPHSNYHARLQRLIDAASARP